jgi:hypothetical protein
MAKIDTKKLLPHASKSHTVSEESVQKVSIIASKLIDVDTILKGSLALDEIRKKKERKAKEKKKRNLKEKMRESIKGAAKGVGKSVKKKAGSMMDWLNKLVFGVVMISLLKLMPVIKPLLPVLGTAFDGLVSIVGWLANAAMTLIHWGYKLYDGLRGMVGNIFGEGGLKVFDNLMAVLNNFMNVAIMGVMALLKFKWLRNFAKNITKRIGKLIMKIPGVKNAVRWAGTMGKRMIGRTGRKLLKTIGQKGLKKTITGGLKTAASKGAAKVGGFAAKLFGKAAKFITPAFKSAKPFVSKFFGRVPIVGPLIVGIVSLLSGEGAGKAIFKMVGAALGGFLGGALAAGVTTATAGIGALVSPAMVMLGELIGVFIGDMLYDLIFGGGLAAIMGKLKKLVGDVFKKALNVGTAIVDFIKNGFTNFIKDFPTIPIPDIKPGAILASILEKVPFGKRILGLGVPFTDWNVKGALNSLPGLQEFLGFFAQAVPGLNTYVEDGKLTKIPNLLMLTPYGMPFLIPHLKSSFFGGKEKVGDGPKGESKKVAGDTGGKTKEEKKEEKKEAARKKREEIAKKFGGLFNKIKGVVGKGIEKGKELVQMAKDRKAKVLEARKAKREEFAKSVGGMFGKLKSAVLGDKKVDSGAGSLQNYAGYESGAPQTAMLPMPPTIIPVGGDEDSGSLGGGSSGGAEDPFETLYVGGLV